MTVAAMEGAVDFSQAKPTTRWYHRLGLVCNELERRMLMELLKSRLQRNLAMMPLIRDSSEMQPIVAVIDKIMEMMQALSAPWFEMQKEGFTVESAREQYKAMFGDPDSPQFQQSMKQLLDSWKTNGKHR